MEGLKTSSSSSVPFVRDILEEEKMLYIMLTETRLREHLYAEVDIPGYTICRVDRTEAVKKRLEAEILVVSQFTLVTK